MVILHAGANILSDINDYKKGLDKEPNPTSGGVVRGYLSIRGAYWSSILFLAVGALIGLFLVWKTGLLLLAIGGLGLLVGILYTRGGTVALKYHALGDLAVFLNFGILGSLGSWYVQTSTFSWVPVIWAIPMAMLVVAILHANNWRDIGSDKVGEIVTIASILGDKGSLYYYAFMIFGPFAMNLGFIFLPMLLPGELPRMPLAFLMTLLALPLAIKLWRKAIKRREPINPLDFIALDGATAQLNLLFGSLCTLSLIINALIVYLL
jgi:1,4-dihydroxy-2-naphthoate octaprenyltransferase